MSKTNPILTIPEPGQVEIVEKPYPNLVPGWAIVQIEIAPICIEHWIYRDHTFELFDDHENMGHERVGIIKEVAEGSKFEVGDRVIVWPHLGCDGTDCFVCRDQLVPGHCLKNPLEDIDDFSDPTATYDVLGGDTAIYMPGLMKIAERYTGSESGAFGFAKYGLAAERHISKLPDELPFRYAAMGICSLGCTYAAAEETGVSAGDTVLVSGVGFIGLGAIANAKYRGARVVVLARNKDRIAIAKKMGADLVVNPEDEDWLEQIHEFTGEYKGVDQAMECSGYEFYQRKAMQALRRYGKIYLLGFQPESKPFSIDLLLEIQNRHLVLTGGHDERVSDRPGILKMLNTPSVQEMAEHMITAEHNMSDAAAAFEHCLSQTGGKAFLYPQENAPA